MHVPQNTNQPISASFTYSHPNFNTIHTVVGSCNVVKQRKNKETTNPVLNGSEEGTLKLGYLDSELCPSPSNPYGTQCFITGSFYIYS